VWVADKTVIPLTRAILSALEVVYDDALYKSTFTYFTLLNVRPAFRPQLKYGYIWLSKSSAHIT